MTRYRCGASWRQGYLSRYFGHLLTVPTIVYGLSVFKLWFVGFPGQYDSAGWTSKFCEKNVVDELMRKTYVAQENKRDYNMDSGKRFINKPKTQTKNENPVSQIRQNMLVPGNR